MSSLPKLAPRDRELLERHLPAKLNGGPPTDDWVDPPAPEAFYGLPGQIVSTIEPHSEADPAGLLVQLLVAVGSACGRSAYFLAEADRHHTNLNALMAGETAKSRKGTSFSHVRRVVAHADAAWEERILGGLVSGEGLIYAVRDQILDGEEVVDEGVSDKRLLAFESEFASVLKVASREGNTLSAIVRQAWDGGRLQTLAKNSPARASQAHVSIIAHITVEELRRYLSATEAANGFMNRYLIALVRRSKVLPEGGRLDPSALTPLAGQVREAMQFAGSIGELRRDEDARALWHDRYEELSTGRPGLVGAVTSRAEAQVMRLALIHAVLDREPRIGVDHLRAALALWDYCEASAQHIFGDTLGDPVADQLLRSLRSASREGLTRTQIRDLFGRHRQKGEIDHGLGLLLERGMATAERVETGGRPGEVWHATT